MLATLAISLAVAGALPDASSISFSEPVRIVEVDTAKLKGELFRLAWSPDAREMYLQTVERDRAGSLKDAHNYALALDGTPPRRMDAEPEWAAAYWTRKSAQAAPARPTFRITVEDRQQRLTSTATPMGGDLARGAPEAGSGGGEISVAAQLEGLTVTTDLVPLDGGPSRLSSSAEIQAIQEQAGAPSRGVRIELPLADVTPGQYLVRATVRRGRETLTERVRDISVRAGTRPAAPDVAIALDPRTVLRGDVVHKLIAALDARTRGGALEGAARAAAAARWSSIDAALPATIPASAGADASTLRGLAAFARAEYPAATTALGAARDADSGNPALSFLLGWAYSGAGDDRAAISAWRHAVVADPTLVPPYLALADAYVRLGETMLARQVVESGLRTLPHSPELLDRRERLRAR